MKKKIIIEILIIIAIVLVISSNILNRPLGDLDEIWNYNFGSCISKGLVPYKDFNIVQTPLLSSITGTILACFSNTLVTMRILAIILCTAIIYLMYKILDKLKINRALNVISIMSLIPLYLNYFCIDYNYFSALILLLIIYLEINLKKDNKWNNLIIGILAGLVVLTKQTIGIFSCIGIIAYKLIFEIYSSKKSGEKIQLKNILYRMLGEAIPILVFICYIVINGAFIDFIDYAILGIKTFSNTIGYENLIKNSEWVITVLAIYMPISFIIMIIYSGLNKDKNLIIISIISIAMFAVAFPISDNIHFLIGIIPGILGNIYLLDKILRKIYKAQFIFFKIFAEAFSTLFVLYFLIFGICNLYKNSTEEKYYCTLKHFENIPISQDFEEEILEVEKYIETNSKKAYILNFDSAIYMIPLDIYNKNYDMLLKGNLGAKGEEGVIDIIKNENDRLYLVLNEELSKNWQHPHKITEYIENNLKHIGTICNYEVYSK